MRDSNGSAQKEQLKNFEYRIIVDGTSQFNDEKLFDENIRLYLKDLSLDKDTDKAKVCFLVGDATTGPDRMITRWCETHGYHYIQFVPDWGDVDVEGAVVRYRNGVPYNAVARYWRSEEMAEVANYLITFYDGVSGGTQDLINRMTDRNHPCRVILVHIEKDEETDHGRQQKGR